MIKLPKIQKEKTFSFHVFCCRCVEADLMLKQPQDIFKHKKVSSKEKGYTLKHKEHTTLKHTLQMGKNGEFFKMVSFMLCTFYYTKKKNI